MRAQDLELGRPLGEFNAVYPLHLSDVSLPSSLPSPFFLPALRLSEPSSSPSFLRAPLLRRSSPGLGGQR